MLTIMDFSQVALLGRDQILELLIAAALSALIGFEREIRQKSAGIRTYTVVGLGAALWLLVSKYGFENVLIEGRVVLDPSRVAAQIVSGLGFIGAGLIFVRRNAVRGLTTAASVWMTAAVGAAAAAGLILLASVTTAIYFFTVLALPPIANWLGRRLGATGPPILAVDYLDGRGLLREILAVITESGFHVTQMGTVRRDDTASSDAEPTVQVVVGVRGRGRIPDLIHALMEVDGVRSVTNTDPDP